jgi:hypothetical protein
MDRRRNLLTLLILITLSLSPAATPTSARPAAMLVWTETPGNKIQPTTAPGSGTAIAIEGARNAYEAAQIVVTASGEPLTGVNLTASDLSDGAGHTLSAAHITFFRQAFIDFTGVAVAEHGNQEVPDESPTNDPRLPDPLIPFTDPYTTTHRPVGAPFDVTAGQNQPVWVDFFIPEDTAAGVYTGQITVTASGKAPVSVPVTLTVWDFALPDMNVITTYFGMHTGPIIQYHSGTWDCSGSDCWLDWNARARTIVKRYEEMAHQHRFSVRPQFVPEPYNDSYDECLPPTHWEGYDAALEPYLDGSYWSDGVPSSFIGAPFSPGVDWGLEQNCTPGEYTALAQAWAAHLRSKGWLDEAIAYAYDEPPDEALPAIAEDALRLQAGDPGWKAQILDTIEPNAGNVGILNPALGIYCVCLRCYEDWSYPDTPPEQVPYGRAEWPGLLTQNIQLWFYESNAQGAPYPTFATNTLWGNEPRVMMWGTWYERATGFLLWDTTVWDPTAPWGPNVQYGKTGDGLLVYPGNHDGLDAPNGSPAEIAIDGPIPSYRLKMVRAGLQDWALFILAERRGVGDYARAQVAQAYTQLGGCWWQGCNIPGFYWKWDDATLSQIRRNIAQAILAAPPLKTVYLPLIRR